MRNNYQNEPESPKTYSQSPWFAQQGESRDVKERDASEERGQRKGRDTSEDDEHDHNCDDREDGEYGEYHEAPSSEKVQALSFLDSPHAQHCAADMSKVDTTSVEIIQCQVRPDCIQNLMMHINTSPDTERFHVLEQTSTPGVVFEYTLIGYHDIQAAINHVRDIDTKCKASKDNTSTKVKAKRKHNEIEPRTSVNVSHKHTTR